MNISEFVELSNSAEHLGDVESRVLFLEDARVVEEGAEVTASDEILQRDETKRQYGIIRKRGTQKRTIAR
jgi:hypothetical protein